MLSYIERLRKAPLGERRQVAFVATAVIVGVVTFLWFGFLTLNLVSPFEKEEPGITPETAGIDSPYKKP